MQAKRLILMSGLAMAFTAVPALAQSGTGNNPSERDRMQDRQDRLRDASQAARDRDSRFGSSTNILTSLEGIWTVNVLVNRTNWDMMSGGSRGTDGRTTPGQGGSELDATNPQQRDRQGGDPGANNPQEQRERDAQQRQDRQTNPQTDRQNPRQPGMQDGATTQGQVGNADGLARSQAILGGDILRTTLIFGAEVATTRTTPGVQDRRDQDRNPDRGEQDRNPQRDQQERDGQNPRDQQGDGMTTTTPGGMMDNNSLRSVSFLGYDESKGQYDLVLMTANGGGIHYFTGNYDQSDRRIIFNSVDGSPATTTTGSPTTTTDRRSTTSDLATGSMSVVLQMEGNDRYTITAYRGAATEGSTVGDARPGGGTEIGGQPGRQDRENNNNPRQEREGQPGQDRTTGQSTLAPNVIYKATYTKADNTMRSQYDRLFDEREQAEGRTPIRVR